MSNGETIIHFRPFAAVVAHAQLEADLANLLSTQYTARSISVFCGSMLRPSCVVFDSKIHKNLSRRDLNALCRSCKSSGKNLADVSDVLLENFTTREDRKRVSEIVRDASEGKKFDVEVDGLPIGAWTTYDSLISRKAVDLDSEEVSTHYFKNLRSSLLAFFASKAIIASLSPTALVVHSYQYAINRAFAGAFLAQGLAVYDIYNAGSTQKPRAIRINKVKNYRKTTLLEDSRLNHPQESPIIESEVAELSAWLEGKTSGQSVTAYSPGRSGLDASSIREGLGLDPNKKVALYLTSSPDELVASYGARLRDGSTAQYSALDQERMVSFLQEAAEEISDWQFVVRLHPRLVSERRNKHQSERFESLSNMLSSDSNSLFANVPSDGFGIWDLAMISDVVINRGSTAGLEMLAAGLPVITLGGEFHEAYPSALNNRIVELDLESLRRGLEAEQASGWSIENSRRAFRWIATWLCRTAVDLAEVGADTESERLESKIPERTRWDGRSKDREPLSAISFLESAASWKREIPDGTAEKDHLGNLMVQLFDSLHPWSGAEGLVSGLADLVTSEYRK